jgi:hypothetical protein
MGKIRLSNTKRTKYQQCPARYNFHYNKKYRTKELSSSLFFGVALDEALNCMLLPLMKKVPKDLEEYVDKSPVDVFIEKFTTTRHNSQNVNIKDFEHSVYTKADFDSTMLQNEDLDELGVNLTYCVDFMDWYGEERKKKSPNIKPEDHLMYRRLNWYSLKRKGIMILSRYNTEVIPQILEVHSIQERINLPNGSGDFIEGVIDFTATFKDEPDKVYIVDNKTASKAYKEEQLTESDQLHLYAYYKECDNIAYIVCEKNIRKREPRVRITVMKGEACQDFTDQLLDNYQEVLQHIRDEEFNPNFDSGCNFFRKRCEYYDICHREKFNDKVLVDLGKKKK